MEWDLIIDLDNLLGLHGYLAARQFASVVSLRAFARADTSPSMYVCEVPCFAQLHFISSHKITMCVRVHTRNAQSPISKIHGHTGFIS